MSFRLCPAANLSIATLAASAKGYGDPACQTSSELGAKFESLVTDLGTYYGSPKQDHVFRARDRRHATLQGTGKTAICARRSRLKLTAQGIGTWLPTTPWADCSKP